MKRPPPFLLIAVTTMVAVIAGYLLLPSKANGLLDPDNGALVARGEAVYLGQCAACHGRNLEGQPNWRGADTDGYLPAPPHDETGHTWHHRDQLLFNIVKLGTAKGANLKDYKTRMPAFETVLSDDDIIAVLSYIKSRWPEDMQSRHDKLNQAYKLKDKEAK
jgi:mono/diheme cytochrome c family protein